ncbi:hypothetical protein LX36DRAFT_740343 [Colletotrichum falcatum]|nr:hypothetical protein LX36DRAFT_740343 [Colletotrichum falcatum]
MSLPNKRNLDFLESRPIKFIIGQEEARYTVDSSSLTALSRSLQSIINHGQSDETEDIVIWRDIKPSTFINLMEYAYSGDYNIPRLSKEGNVEQTIVEVGNSSGGSGREPFHWSVKDFGPTALSDTDDDSSDSSDSSDSPDSAFVPCRRSNRLLPKATEGTLSSATEAVPLRKKSIDKIQEPISLRRWMLQISEKKKSRQKSSAQYKFCQKQFSPEATTIQTTIKESSYDSEAWLKDIQQQHNNGYTSKRAFLAHANLYIVASKFGITDLRDICLHRILLSLLHAPSTGEVAAAVFHTIRVVYDRTNLGDPLRLLLVKFCITDMEWMMRQEGDEGIVPLLRSVPGFAADLLLEIPHDYWVEIRDGGR